MTDYVFLNKEFDKFADKELVASEFDYLYDSGDILSISTKVEKLQKEHRIGLPSQKQKGEG